VLLVGGSGLHFRAVVDPLEFPPTDESVRSSLESRPDSELRGELLGADPLAGSVVDMANRRRVIRAVEVHRLTGLTPSARAASRSGRAVADYESLLPTAMFGLDLGDAIERAVSERVERMRNDGLLDEVRDLAPRLGTQASHAVGYKELLRVVAGDVDEDLGFERVTESTIALVKRQRTYFRRDPRIRWLDPDSEDLVEVIVEAIERSG
jgi:tRNA dimethylallyltransferase